MNFANTSLFIGDLPKFCNEVDLEQLFAPFGPIMDVKIKRNVNTGKTLSYGFVTFSNEATASEALRRLDGTMFYGRKLRLRWAMYNARSQNNSGQNGIINSVYVRFVSSRVDQFVTEEDLHRVFQPFGSLVDVSIKESSVDPRLSRQSGYGFVHFACDTDGVEAAFQAVSSLDNAVIDGVTYNVELSKNLLRQFNETRGNGNGSGNGSETGTSTPRGDTGGGFFNSPASSAPPSPSPSLSMSMSMRGPTPPPSLPPASPSAQSRGLSPSSSLSHLPTSGYRNNNTGVGGGVGGVGVNGGGVGGVAMSSSRHSSRSASPLLSLGRAPGSNGTTPMGLRGPSPLRLPPQHPPLTPTGSSGLNGSFNGSGGAGLYPPPRQSPSPGAMRLPGAPGGTSPQAFRGVGGVGVGGGGLGIAALSDPLNTLSDSLPFDPLDLDPLANNPFRLSNGSFPLGYGSGAASPSLRGASPLSFASDGVGRGAGSVSVSARSSLAGSAPGSGFNSLSTSPSATPFLLDPYRGGAGGGEREWGLHTNSLHPSHVLQQQQSLNPRSLSPHTQVRSNPLHYSPNTLHLNTQHLNTQHNTPFSLGGAGRQFYGSCGNGGGEETGRGVGFRFDTQDHQPPFQPSYPQPPSQPPFHQPQGGRGVTELGRYMVEEPQSALFEQFDYEQYGLQDRERDALFATQDALSQHHPHHAQHPHHTHYTQHPHHDQHPQHPLQHPPQHPQGGAQRLPAFFDSRAAQGPTLDSLISTDPTEDEELEPQREGQRFTLANTLAAPQGVVGEGGEEDDELCGALTQVSLAVSDDE